MKSSATSPERFGEEPGILLPQGAVAFLEQIEAGNTDGIGCWRSDDVERRAGLAIEGQGLFSLNDIPANMLVAIKQGRVMSGDGVAGFAPVINGSQQQIGPDQFLAGISTEEVDRNLVGYNHSCEPNARVALFKGVSLAFLITREPVEAGQELTVDYGVAETSRRAHHLDPCLCGSPQCRGVVNPQTDWQDREFQKKYAGEFPWYVQELIDQQG